MTVEYIKFISPIVVMLTHSALKTLINISIQRVCLKKFITLAGIALYRATTAAGVTILSQHQTQ